MKKKVLCMLLTGMLAVSMLAGCGNSNNNSTADNNGAESSNVESEKESKDTAEEAEDVATGNFDASSAIAVYSREDGSGTRGAFIELFGIEQKDESGEKVDYTTVEATITNSTEVMLQSIAGDTYGIGYVSLGSLNDTVKAVTIDGAEATVDNIKAGTYGSARPFNIATAGDVSEVAQDFINYILSADGQAVIEGAGYIAVSDAAAFESNGAEGKIVVGGSSSVSPVMEKLIEAYKAINTGAEIELQTSDSTTGMTGTADGTLDIGMASRELKSSEVEAGLTGTKIAMDGIAVIVNLENPTEDLAADAVRAIFMGENTEWDAIQ
ncbi:MAG: substrate-binding domain-containing protein [Roseburia sp.]|nr:substrate-binding domain-containing protein [Roseburia sp.]